MLHLAVEFDHRVFRECLRTSAAPGSGEAIAPRLARAGATIAVADLDAAGAGAVAASIGGESFGVGIDISRPWPLFWRGGADRHPDQ